MPTARCVPRASGAAARGVGEGGRNQAPAWVSATTTPGHSGSSSADADGDPSGKKKRRRSTGTRTKTTSGSTSGASGRESSRSSAPLDPEVLEKRRGRERNGRPIGRYLMCVQVRD